MKGPTMRRNSVWICAGFVSLSIVSVGAVKVQLQQLAQLQAGRAPRAAPARGWHQVQTQPTTPTPTPARELVTSYCVACHNDRLKTAGLLLDKVDTEHIGEQAEIWEKVVQKLRTRQMPPAAAARRPNEATYDLTASWLESELDRAAQIHPNPGRPGIHRLNR